MKDTECPYCGEKVEITHDEGYGFDEYELHQQECPECYKVFAYTTLIIIRHTAFKADCLNDGPHTYKPTKTYPAAYARLRCETCGDEKPIDA